MELGTKSRCELWIEIIYNCNFSCDFCYNVFDLSSNSINSQISPTDFEVILEKISSTYFIEKIALSGGEPTLHKELDELIVISKRFSSTIIIATNGLNLNKKFLDSHPNVKDCSLQISMLSGNPDQHERISGLKNSYLKVVENLAYLSQNNCTLTIIYVATPMNMEYFMDVFEICFLMNIQSIVLNEERLDLNVLNESLVRQLKKEFCEKLALLDSDIGRFPFPTVFVPTIIPAEIARKLTYIKSVFDKQNSLKIVVDSLGQIKKCPASLTSLGHFKSYDFTEFESDDSPLNCTCAYEESVLKIKLNY